MLCWGDSQDERSGALSASLGGIVNLKKLVTSELARRVKNGLREVVKGLKKRRADK